MKKIIALIVLFVLSFGSISSGNYHPGWDLCRQSNNLAPGCGGTTNQPREPREPRESKPIDWANDPLVRFFTAPFRWLGEGIDSIQREAAKKRRADIELSNTYTDQANSAKARGDHEQALKLYKQALSTHPDSTEDDHQWIKEYRQWVEQYERYAEALERWWAEEHKKHIERQERFAEANDRVAKNAKDKQIAPINTTLQRDIDGNLTNGITPELELKKIIPEERQYEPSGNALIQGTGSIIGYYVRENASPAVLAKAQKIAMAIMEKQGKPYDGNIDFHRYNFVLGIAASTDIFTDLATRVEFDEWSNGKFTTEQKNAYASMKGREFKELACHSNGAMICLTALNQKDVKAANVVLYGPQITPESLVMWNKLVKDGQIKSLQIYLNQGDPVPAASMLASNPVFAAPAIAAPYLSAPLFDADVMSKAINALAPNADIKTFVCKSTPDVDCHNMKLYKENRGCAGSPPSPAKIVPGTTIPGRGGALEPPLPPCI